MSYDLTLLPPEHCASPEQIQSYIEAEASSPTSAQRARMDALAASIQRAVPGLDRFAPDFQETARLRGTSVEEARANERFVELDKVSDGLQIVLQPDQVSVTLPYWHDRATLEELWPEIETVLEILVREGGFRIYDPQLDRLVDDPATIRDQAIASYGHTMKMLESLGDRAPRSSTSRPGTRPWWKFW
ncbi:MAG: hypothetical protein H6807_10225 [Planctomycetes bacterium]|nr:hypothetical protein [Planctomycetota bacterium]